MATDLDLTGIDNVGEFYSHHYLDTLLGSDLKALFERFAAEDRAPEKKLAGLSREFYAALQEAEEADDPVERWRPLRRFHALFIEALGYPYKPELIALDDGSIVPVLRAETRDGQPYLWIIDATLPKGEDASPFEETWLPAQCGDLGGDAPALPVDDDKNTLNISDTLSELIFHQDRPPRWVLFLAGADAFLIERSKWAHGKYLRFRLGELFGRKQAVALRAVVGLLHRDVVNPDEALCLHDTLDESSHKHAFAVSTDLKHGARTAIELLANEALRYRREVLKDKTFGDEALAAELTQECLIYLYRLLFLFYVEARGGELGVTPMKSDAYRLGYSLESLRDLELVSLTTPDAQDGFYIHHSLSRLFEVVNRGFPMRRAPGQVELADSAPNAFSHGAFTITGLRSALFDAERTPILGKVKLRNVVVQEVIQSLSLSRVGDRRRGRGRISYAQLGINQLGAVYEGLLAYRGFFAQEDLFEVKAETEMTDPEARSFFVTKSELPAYSPGEVVKGADGRRVGFPKGTYIFRLSGRDREKSASYYTPEVLTRCLTKYTLKERLEGVSADEILTLTVLEPAMGSGAFLNEAVNQLADAYLERKQKELAEVAARETDGDKRKALEEAARIRPEEYALERQRVKAYISTRNVYGVDLNPLAAELGKISLWLNVLHEGARAPYLDARIAVGNSLIGARREVFSIDSLGRSAKKDERWTNLVPTAVPLGAARPAGTVYHFLLADEGMTPFDGDKVVKALEPAAVKRITTWRKSMLEPYSAAEIERLVRISDRIDQLFEEHTAARIAYLEETVAPQVVWGQPAPAPRPYSAEACVEIERQRMGQANAPGKRLAAVMDAWCALWFWPIARSALLPTRAQWLSDVEARLEDLRGDTGQERRTVVEEVRDRIRFHHWSARFPEVFAQRGGFDVILGNPPWVKLQWNEQGVLSDFQPLLALKRLSAKEAADQRAEVLGQSAARTAYFEDFEDLMGSKGFVGALQNEPLLQGIQANLYKVFLTRAWSLSSPVGFTGLFHQSGVFDDAAGGTLRRELYRRLSLVVRLQNKLMLFESILHTRMYALTISRGSPTDGVRFRLLANAFHPRTLDESVVHDGNGPVPGIKTEAADWDLRGHRSRIVEVDEDALALFASLYDAEGTPALEARLPIVHSREIMRVLERFAKAPRKLADLGDDVFATEHFHETNQQHDGTIRRETRYPKDATELVLSGPHFYVATPFYKNPKEGCRHHQDYTAVDLATIPDYYLPRTNYVPACDPAEYRRRTPHWRDKPVTDYYRHVNRRMIAPTGERTLVSTIAPPGPAHVDLVFSMALADEGDLLLLSGACSSIPVDFIAKVSGKSDARQDLLNVVPIPTRLVREIRNRALRLNCLTTHYAVLWARNCEAFIHEDGFARTDSRLHPWTELGRTWTFASPLRTAFSRRQGFLELDALIALDLDIDIEALITAYKVQFPILQENERETFYDQRGHIVFTVNKGLPGVGLSRAEWEPIRDAKAGDRLPDFAREYIPPFDRCDREADMRQAYAFFKPLLDGKPAGSGGESA